MSPFAAQTFSAYLKKRSTKVLLTVRKDQEGTTVLMLINVLAASVPGYLGPTLMVIPWRCLAFPRRKRLFLTVQVSEHFHVLTMLNVKTLEQVIFSVLLLRSSSSATLLMSC